MSVISQRTQNLIQQYNEWYKSQQKPKGAATIHADEVASQVAGFYEKIRGVIDWREEHLLRRSAIERILKRRIFIRIEEKIDAQSFILELIRSGHFPNDKIEELKIDQIQKTLDKYIFIVEGNSQLKKNKSSMHLQDWLSSIAACEVEEILDPPRKERILIDYMFELMKERIIFKNSVLDDEEKNTQIYIATQRALFKLDNSIIAYHLLKRQYPQWGFLDISGVNKNILAQISQNIYVVWEDIDKKLHHRASEKIYRVCERYDTPYLMLGDILSSDPSRGLEKLSNPEMLEGEIKKFYQGRLKTQKSKVFRAAFYSTVSIFITKILVALAFEYPIDKWMNQFNPQSLGLSIVIPTILMLILVLSIKPPRKENLQKVIMETMKITYVSEKDAYLVKSPRRSAMKGAIFVFYLITFILAFGLIWVGLGFINFSWPSKIIFIIFLSLISFAGTKIKERAKELSVEEEKGTIFGSILDWFSLPFIQLGKWMSGQWAKYSIALVLILTLIDLPFQVFIEFLEQWRTFIKERKEEIH